MERGRKTQKNTIEEYRRMYAHNHKYIDTSAPSHTHACEGGTIHTHKCSCVSVSSAHLHFQAQNHTHMHNHRYQGACTYTHTHMRWRTPSSGTHTDTCVLRDHTQISHAHSCTCLHPGTHMKSFTVTRTQVSILIFTYRCSILLAFNPRSHCWLSSVQNLEKVLSSFASLFTCV